MLFGNHCKTKIKYSHLNQYDETQELKGFHERYNNPTYSYLHDNAFHYLDPAYPHKLYNAYHIPNKK